MAPDPTRIVGVPAALYPITSEVAALAIPTMLWCSASQNRRYPQVSACFARSSVLRSASAGVAPSTTIERSRMERGMCNFIGTATRLAATIRVCDTSAQETDGNRELLLVL